MNEPAPEVRRLELRRHATRLLADEQRLLARLSELLERETPVVNGEDVAAIERIGEQRGDCVATLSRLDAERRDACRMHSFGDGREAFARLLAWCDPAGELGARWRSNLDLARRCRDLNDRNGAIVATRLGAVRNLLNSLRGNESNHDYGPQSGRGMQVAARELGRA